jgi:hypothetical protein
MKSALGKWVLGMAFVAFAASVATVSAQVPIPGMGPDQGAFIQGMGTWRFNPTMSKFSPGPAYKSLIIKFEPIGGGVRVTTEGVNGDGSKNATEYTAKYDGKDVPFKGSAAVDTVSLVRKDDQTTVRTDKKAGKVVATLTRVVAKDSQSFTVTVKGTNAKGEPVNNTVVFDKIN